MSAYMALEGAYSFTSTPMAPPGTQIIVHEKPTQCGSWAPHGIEGWYLGPAMDHHKCYHTFLPSTQSERISDTIHFLHHNHIVPVPTPIELATEAAKTLTDV